MEKPGYNGFGGNLYIEYQHGSL